MAILICKSGTCSYVSESEEEKFCMLCGQPLISKCPKCNAEIKSKEQNFCHKCSERLKDEPLPLDMYTVKDEPLPLVDIYDMFTVKD